MICQNMCWVILEKVKLKLNKMDIYYIENTIKLNNIKSLIKDYEIGQIKTNDLVKTIQLIIKNK